MRALWLSLAAIFVLLAGCAGAGGANVSDCEQSLTAKLKSPASYKRISATSMTLNAGKPPHYQLVEIEYDADNSFGVALRDKERCTYRLDAQGRPTLEQFDPYEGLSAESLDAAADAAVENALGAASSSPAGASNESTDDISAEDGIAAEPEIAASAQYPGNCYKDYCPCEPPQGGMDQLLCDQLEEGIDVDIQTMIAGRGFREARRQMDEMEPF